MAPVKKEKKPWGRKPHYEHRTRKNAILKDWLWAALDTRVGDFESRNSAIEAILEAYWDVSLMEILQRLEAKKGKLTGKRYGANRV